MHISFDIPKAHSVTRDDTYKDPQKPFIDFPDPSYADLGQANISWSSSAEPNAKDGSRGSILAKLGFVTQKSALFPLLFCPIYFVQLFVGAFLPYAAVVVMDQLWARVTKSPISIWMKTYIGCDTYWLSMKLDEIWICCLLQ